MKFDKNKLLTTIAAAALALAVGACSSSSDDDNTLAATTPAPPPTTDPETPAPLTELQTAQADAAKAAEAAMTASTDAADAVKEAMTAIANLATMQTNATAADLAGEAQTAADKAKLAYEHAKAASEAAAEAEDVTAAVEARVMAETAMGNAVTYGTTATEKAGEAETAAMAELMIVGTVKTVGGTDLKADAGSSVVVTGEDEDAQTVRTGLIKSMNPMTTAEGSEAVPGVNGDPESDPVAKYVAPVAAADDRTFSIGKLVDSADDMARLMIVTQYAGSRTVKVYAAGDDDQNTGTKAGYLSIDDADTTDVNEETTNANNVPLKSEGSYYLAGTDGTLDEEDDVVLAATKPVEVFSYVSPAASNTDGDKTYVVWKSDLTVGTTTTTTYTVVDILVPHDIDGDADTAGDSMQEVTAKIPEATDYEHIHFGVWAALGAPEKNGDQDLSGLGIGFVQNFSGEGLTPIGGGSDDMPNNGSATYNGNWVASVQTRDEDGNGAINLDSGDAMLTADFEDDEITATLTGLATLSGDISGNTFEGDTAEDITHESLDTEAKFTGEFSGGFYGAKAAEAGGIFDFTSEDAEGGAFRGAFGGDRD